MNDGRTGLDVACEVKAGMLPPAEVKLGIVGAELAPGLPKADTEAKEVAGFF